MIDQGFAAKGVRSVGTKKTHCIRGHERTPKNVAPNGKCRTCDRVRHLEPRPTRATLEHVNNIRHANNVAGAIHYIARRRQRTTTPIGPAKPPTWLLEYAANRTPDSSAASSYSTSNRSQHSAN